MDPADPIQTSQRPTETNPGHGDATTTLVVGLDGSQPSWDAFWWACGEARRTSGRVIAVYVSCMADVGLQVATETGLDPTAYLAIREQALRQACEELQTETTQAGLRLGVPVEFVHLDGDPADNLLRMARDVHADVIVVGRSTKLHHRITGSLGRRLSSARHAPITVIVP